MPERQTMPSAASAQVKPDATEEPRASKQQPPAGVQPVEAEDAQLTGTTHPQQREILKDNIPREEKPVPSQAERHPETPAGIHATGSFTEKK
jgi:hypothetical protein